VVVERGGVNILNVTSGSACSNRWALNSQKFYCCIQNPDTENINILRRINSSNPSSNAGFPSVFEINVRKKIAGS
jgi:hypothetical protein